LRSPSPRPRRPKDDQVDGEPAEDDAEESEDGEDERRIVDLTGHGTAWGERLPQVQAAIAAVEGITTGGDGP
jgi:hypothetical protein